MQSRRLGSWIRVRESKISMKYYERATDQHLLRSVVEATGRAHQIVCPDARDNQFEVPGYRHMSR